MCVYLVQSTLYAMCVCVLTSNAVSCSLVIVIYLHRLEKHSHGVVVLMRASSQH